MTVHEQVASLHQQITELTEHILRVTNQKKGELGNNGLNDL